MKKIILAILALTSFQAQAKYLTPDEFTQIFVAEANRIIPFKNQALVENYEGRNVEYPKFYCKKLNQKQIALVHAAASIPDITVGEFKNQILNDFKCFDQLAPFLDHTSFWGNIFNMRALTKDAILMSDVLTGLAPNRTWVRDTDTLLNFQYNQPAPF